VGVPDKQELTLDPQPWMTASETQAIIAALSADGATVQFVGGCVRDALAGRPVKDVDIATADPPDRVLELLAVAGVKAIPTGIDHGTVTAVIPPAHFEITTLRIDTETDGRRARVEFSGDWDADAARRDFTINAIYCDPDGRLFDPTGGIADLRAKVVRFVGDPDARIKEDFLRILRFFRFTAFYGDLGPAADGVAACRANAASLPSLSGERVAGEVLRLLESSNAATVLRVMEENEILQHILPELNRLDRLAGLIAIDSDDPDPLRRLAAASATEQSALHGLADRLRLSNAERERLVAIAMHAGELSARLNARGRRQLLYRLGAQTVSDVIYLAWAEESTDPRAWRNHLRSAASWNSPSLPVRGADVLELGVPHGPTVGLVLEEVENWWVQGDFKADREMCLRKLQRIVRARSDDTESGGSD